MPPLSASHGEISPVSKSDSKYSVIGDTLGLGVGVGVAVTVGVGVGLGRFLANASKQPAVVIRTTPNVRIVNRSENDPISSLNLNIAVY